MASSTIPLNIENQWIMTSSTITCFHHVILVLLKKELKTETIFLTKNLILDI